MKKVTYILALLAILAIGALIGGNWLRDNKLPNFRKQAEIYVYPEMEADKVLEMIADKAQVISRKSLARSFQAKQVSDYLTPGHYTISPGDASVYVARMLNNGWQTPVRLSLAGNLRIKSNIAAKIASQLLLDSATVYKALNDEHLLAGYGFTPRNVFSLLMPDTYDIYWTASMNDVLDKQKAAWDAFWTPEREAKAKALMSWLRSHRAEFQRHVADRMALKYTPVLDFRRTEAVERGDRVLGILDELGLGGTEPVS